MEYRNSLGGVEPLFLESDFLRRPYHEFADGLSFLDDALNNGSSLYDDFPLDAFPSKAYLSDYLEEDGTNPSLLDVNEFSLNDELKAIPDSPTSPCDLLYDFLEAIDIDELYRDGNDIPCQDPVQDGLCRDENTITYQEPVQDALYIDGNTIPSQDPDQNELRRDEQPIPSQDPDQSLNSPKPNDSFGGLIYSTELDDLSKVPENVVDLSIRQQLVLYEHTYAKPPEIVDESFDNLSPKSVDSGISTTSTDHDFISEQWLESDSFKCIELIVVNEEKEPIIVLSSMTTDISTSNENGRYSPINDEEEPIIDLSSMTTDITTSNENGRYSPINDEGPIIDVSSMTTDITTSNENGRYSPYQGKPRTTLQKSRKKEHNRKSASRYRMKKKEKIETIFGEADKLEKKNEELKVTLKDLHTEIDYLKRLMIEVASVRLSKTKN